MAIKLERDDKGNVYAVDEETGKIIGHIVTMEEDGLTERLPHKGREERARRKSLRSKSVHQITI